MSEREIDDLDPGEEWLPRENDHLVEPFYSGLGAEPPLEPDPEVKAPRPGWLARLFALLWRG